MKLPPGTPINPFPRKLRVLGRVLDAKNVPVLDGTYLVPGDYLEHLEENGPEDKYHDIILLPDVLKDPDAIFGGLCRENFEDGRCFCSIPKTRFRIGPGGGVREIPKDKVFCVYVKQKPDKTLVVLDWEWRRQCPKNPFYPLNWETDFKETIWTRS